MSKNLASHHRLCAWRMENDGMFRAGLPMDWGWGPGSEDPERDGGKTPFQFIASWDGELPLMTVTYACGQIAYDWTIELGQSRSGHIHFKCPHSGKPVLDLYRWDGSLASRAALRLRYPCQQVTAREWWMLEATGYKPCDLGHNPMPKRRYTSSTPPQKLLDQRAVTQVLVERDVRQRDHARRQRQEAVKRLQAQHAAGGDPSSTPPLPGEAVALSRFLKAAREVVELREDYTPLQDAELLVLENLPGLDLRAVARNGYVTPKARTCVQLRWKRQPQELQYAYLSVDLSDMDQNFAEILFGRWGGVAHRQRLALLPQRGTAERPRFSFDIPGHRAAEVLVYREGRFAPRRLQRLVHQSQRSSLAFSYSVGPLELERAPD